MFSLLLIILSFASMPQAKGAEFEGSTYATPGALVDWASVYRDTAINLSSLVEGSTITHMNGNIDGDGAFIKVKNHLVVGYELRENYVLEIGDEFRQYFRAADPAKPDRADLEARDPFVGIKVEDFIRGRGFSVSSRTRFYIPISDYTRRNVGKTFDTGSGNLQMGIAPSWKLKGGAFSFTLPIDAYANFAKGKNASREDFSLKFKAQMALRLAAKWAARMEYNSGDIRHNVQGKWSKFKDAENGHRLFAGLAYFPTKALSVTPQLAWGRDSWRWDRTEVSLHASYNIH